jgi:hypothetical protein
VIAAGARKQKKEEEGYQSLFSTLKFSLDTA